MSSPVRRSKEQIRQVNTAVKAGEKSTFKPATLSQCVDPSMAETFPKVSSKKNLMKSAAAIDNTTSTQFVQALIADVREDMVEAIKQIETDMFKAMKVNSTIISNEFSDKVKKIESGLGF